MSEDTKGKTDLTSMAGKTRFLEVSAKIIQPHCITCHTNHPQNINFRTYEEFVMFVLPGQPEFSIVWEKVSQDLMPKGGPALTLEEKELLFKWISDGAIN